MAARGSMTAVRLSILTTALLVKLEALARNQVEVDEVETGLASFLQLNSRSARTNFPLGAEFFDSFSQGESNYVFDADSGARLPEAWDSRADNPYKVPSGHRPAEWYHTSSSNGDQNALQTHYPALATGLAGSHVETGAWKVVTREGKWEQEYRFADSKKHEKNTPEWFDSSVMQYDGYGRQRPPSWASEGVVNWQERTVNTTLSCQTAGCIANTTLQVFDSRVEYAKGCKLSIALHPTDFDDQYSGERLTFIEVNGRIVNTDCFPMVNGCNASTQMPLFSCLNELSLDTIIDENGTLEIAAQISDVVDECPYEGNLLAGVPMVTCMIAPKVTPELGVIAPSFPILPIAPSPPPEYIHLSAPIRCPQRGCSASAKLVFNVTPMLTVVRCSVSVTVNQTDYDNEQDTQEQIEYIKVDGATLVANMTPGQNPCRSVWAGAPLSLAEIEHTAISNHSITPNASTGLFMITVDSKISDSVDECASEGYLFNGRVDAYCTMMPPDREHSISSTTTSRATVSSAQNVTDLPASQGANSSAENATFLSELSQFSAEAHVTSDALQSARIDDPRPAMDNGPAAEAKALDAVVGTEEVDPVVLDAIAFAVGDRSDQQATKRRASLRDRSTSGASTAKVVNPGAPVELSRRLSSAAAALRATFPGSSAL